MPCRRELDENSHLYLVDASGYIFRAFHALPPLTRKSDGLPVGAVSGYCNMLFKLLEDSNSNGDEVTHFACIFDHSGKSFRNDLDPRYKAQRPPAPEDLVPQFPLVREATIAFRRACGGAGKLRGRRHHRCICPHRGREGCEGHHHLLG